MSCICVLFWHNISMRLIWLACIFLICPISHAPISANEELSQSEIQELIKDEVWREESLNIEKIIQQQASLVQFINSEQVKINNTTTEYLETDMTNETLWEILDEIYANSETIIEISDDLTMSIKISTSSKVPIARDLYSESIEIIYEFNSYISKNNKVTKDLIDYLREGDTDSYTYLYGKSGNLNSDLLEIMAKRNFAQAKLLPSSSVQKHLLLLEAEALEFNLIVQRINANHLSGQLTKPLFSKLENSSNLKYKNFKNSKSYKNLLSAIEQVETDLEIFLSNGDNRSSRETIRKFLVSAKLYADSTIRGAESWKEVYLFYKKYIDNLDAIESDPYINAEFEDLIDRQTFILNESARYAEEFSATWIAYMEIIPTLLKE